MFFHSDIVTIPIVECVLVYSKCPPPPLPSPYSREKGVFQKLSKRGAIRDFLQKWAVDKSSILWGHLVHFPAPNPKNKKETHPEKSSYIFSKKSFVKFFEMELPDPKIKMFLIFSYTSELELSSLKNKRFLIFIKKKRKEKYFLIFSQKRFFLYFRNWNFLALASKALIFQEELSKPQQPKFLILLQKSLRINFSKNILG